MNRKASKSMFVMLMIIVSSIFTINLLPVNAVDKTTNYSSVFYVTEQKGDAYYLSGYEFRNNSTLGYLKNNVYDTYSGFKFTTVTLTNASIIDHAYLSLYSSDGVDNYDYMVTIYGEDIDSGNDFDTSTDLTGATLTSSYSNWNMKNLEGNQWRNSTDIKTSINEIINRGGWASGNNVSLILLGVISANGYRTFRTWDYDGGHTYRAKLYINYHISEPVSNGNPWEYISDNYDNWDLLNETNGYTWWEVWNDSIICSVKHGYNTWYSDTDDVLGTLYGFGESPGFSLETGDHLQKYGNYLYTLGGFSGNSTSWIYRSIDNGDNWIKWIDTLTGSSGTYLEIGSNGVAFLINRVSPNKPIFRMFNVTSKASITGHGVGSFGNSASEVPRGFIISPDGSHLYVLTVDSSSSVIYVYEKTYDATSWTSHNIATISYINYSYGGISGFYDSSNAGVNWYIIMCADYLSNVATGYYIKYDYTIGSAETITDATHLVHEDHIDCNFNTAGEIGIVWIGKTGVGIANHIIFRYRAAGKTGALGPIYTTGTLGYVGICGPSKWSTVWTIAYYWPTINNNHCFIASIDNSGNLVDKVNFVTSVSTSALPMLGVVCSEGEHQFILLNPDGYPVDEIPEFPPTPILMNTSINDWLFKGEVYQLNATVQNTNEAEFNLTDGYHTMIFYYNNLTSPITQKVYTLDADGTLINEDVIGGIKTSYTLDVLNVTHLTWKFILGINVLDIFNTTITYKLVSWNMTSLISVSISGVTNSTVNIYNLGGNAQYSFSGDGSHVLGGHPFELKATNSSLVVGGSYAESWLIYRRLQYVHLLADLDLDNEVEAVEHFEPLVNIGYAEFGIDYKLEGEEGDDWIEGWKCRIYAQEINVGTYGGGNDMAYIKMYVYWYNRGDFVTGNEFYSYHQGYDITPHFPTPRRDFTFWVDLWFDKTNSSTVFGGRVNAEYYGYYEDGSNWWFNSAFRPMMGNTSYSMILGNIKDSNGTIIQSKRISLVRVTSKVAKTAPGMGGLGDDNTYKLKPFNTLEVNLATDRMEGIDTPPIIPTAYLDIGGYGIWGFLIDAIGNLGNGFFNLTKLFLSSADTILSWFGLPYGTFSNIISFLSILPTMLYNFLNILYQMFTSIITVIVSGSALFILTIAGWVSVMISTINLISNFITIFIDLFRGGYGTGVDIWTTYQVATWLSLILLLLPLMWFQRLYKSKHPLETLMSDIEMIKIFTNSMINFFDWLFDKVLYIAQVFITLIRG